jgi:spermidine synthase
MDYGYLRRPGARTLDEVCGLYRAAGWWGRQDDRGRLRRIISGSHCFLVARHSGRIVGMGRALSDRANDAYIQDVFVAPEYRGRDIGAAMVRRLVRRLRADGLRWIGLIAATGTPPFYKRLGFRGMPGYAPMLAYKGY